MKNLGLLLVPFHMYLPWTMSTCNDLYATSLGCWCLYKRRNTEMMMEMNFGLALLKEEDKCCLVEE